MASMFDLINNIVSVSDFSRGGASRAFARAQGAPVVVVRNNSPVAVVLSVREYSRLTSIAEQHGERPIAIAGGDLIGDPDADLAEE